MDYSIPSHRIEVVAPCEFDRSAPIDLAHLRRFTLGNTALEIEVLQLFSGDAPAVLDRLERAGDQKAWFEAAHTLKGSARAIGARRVGALAERAERLGRTDPGTASLIASLKEALREAAAFVQHHARQTSAA